jgi:glycine/sarcosine N-methyltransferase
MNVSKFYDDISDYYRFIFPNWLLSVDRQSDILLKLIEQHCCSPLLSESSLVWDSTCGIGTQTFGLAKRFENVIGSDISSRAIEKARDFLQNDFSHHSQRISFHVSDLLSPDKSIIKDDSFDLVVALDNALPHFQTDNDLRLACQSLFNALKSNGTVLISIRNYDEMIRAQARGVDNLCKTTMPSICNETEHRTWIVFQTWHWASDASSYDLDMYFTLDDTKQAILETKKFSSKYRALSRATLSETMKSVGFVNIKWLMEDESKFYQPILIAFKK